MAYAGLDVEAMYELSEKAARAVLKRLQGSSLDDMVQDGIEWMLSHTNKIEEWHNDPNNADAGYAKTFKSVYHHILEQAQKEKAQRTGYKLEDNFYYSVPALRRMLPLYYLDQIAERQAGLAEQLNLPDRDAYLDIRLGLQRVEPEVGYLLHLWFAEDRDIEDVYHQVETANNITNEAARKRVYRVVQKLQNALGGPPPVTSEFEGRKAQPNAAARAETDRTYGAG